jgi:steroid delta-isomerase-like uncharacterized protein
MSAEENKAIVRWLIAEVWNGGDMTAADALVAADVMDHGAFPGQPPGREGYKWVFALLRTAFPDLHYTVEDMVAEGDRVVVRWTFQGTHRGEFMGMSPTGNQVKIEGMVIVRMAAEQLAEEWLSADTFGLMQQLGAIPAQQATA